MNLFIGDFGESKSIEGTVAQTCVGTFETMAPEVLDGNSYSFPIDIWSLGCIWYRLISGNNPFSGA